MSSWLLVLLLCCAPVTAQVVQLSPRCPNIAGGSGGLHSLVVSNPLAGSSLQIWTQTAISFSPAGCPTGPVLSVLVIGFQDPNTPLASCGCALRALPGLIDSAAASFIPQGACLATTNRSMPLPASAAGFDLYIQSFGLMPPSAAAPGMCTDFGFPFLSSQAYRVTVQ